MLYILLFAQTSPGIVARARSAGNALQHRVLPPGSLYCSFKCMLLFFADMHFLDHLLLFLFLYFFPPGRGQLCLWMALNTPLLKSTCVEYAKERHNLGMEELDAARTGAKDDPAGRVLLVHGDLFQCRQLSHSHAHPAVVSLLSPDRSASATV